MHRQQHNYTYIHKFQTTKAINQNASHLNVIFTVLKHTIGKILALLSSPSILEYSSQLISSCGCDNQVGMDNTSLIIQYNDFGLKLTLKQTNPAEGFLNLTVLVNIEK